jgi:hypothetical protein
MPAKKIDDVSVEMGRLVKVENQDRPKFSNSNRQYFAVWVEDAKGKNKKCLLMTEKELQRMEYRASRNKEDLPNRSFWSKVVE